MSDDQGTPGTGGTPPPPPPPPPPGGWTPPPAPPAGPPTTPPPPPPAPDQWAPPTPGYGQAPAAPTWTAPPAAPPAWGQAPPAPGVPGAQPAGTGRKRHTGLIVALVVLLVLVAGGIAAVLVVESGPAEVSIDRCVIAADGTMVATGGLTNGTGTTTIDVEFRDAGDGGGTIDRELVTVPEGRSRWRAAGTAGDEVQRVTCVATVQDGG